LQFTNLCNLLPRKLHIEKHLLPLTFLVILFAFLTQLNIMELRGEESRRGMIAIEMYARGEWIVPTMHGWNYYNKPPLWNWILAASIWLFGSAKEWVLRLPGILSILLTGYLIFGCLAKEVSREAAILGGLFFLTCADLLFFGSVLSAEIDPFLTLILFIQSISIYYGFYHKKQWHFLVAWIMLAIGLLTKGLPSLVFFGLTILGIAIMERRWKWWWCLPQWIGGFLAAFLIGSYFYIYQQSAPLDVFLINLLDDALQKSALEDRPSRILSQIFTFPFDLLKITLPWSLLLFFFFKKKMIHPVAKVPLLRFCVIFLIFNVWIYWISSNTHNRYLYPFFPFISILTAGIFCYLIQNKSVVPNFWKRKTIFKFRTALLLILLLGIARLVYNFAIQPIQAKSFHHRVLASTLLEKTNGAPIHLTGELFIQEANPEFGSILLQWRQIELPPQLSYKIPYYLYLQSGTVMEYQPKAKRGSYYLIFKNEFVNKNGSVLHTFFENWTNREMLLVQWD
jgi:4-amino-4-deoxy-L-arabinose transferase-like glycosyltransferase